MAFFLHPRIFKKPYESLNCSFNNGDDKTNVLKNLENKKIFKP